MQRQRVKRKWWVRPIFQSREKFGAYHAMFPEMENDDRWSFKNFSRMNPELFRELEAKLEPLIGRQNTTFRKSISTGERLAITLRYLATGKTTLLIFTPRTSSEMLLKVTTGVILDFWRKSRYQTFGLLWSKYNNL